MFEGVGLEQREVTIQEMQQPFKLRHSSTHPARASGDQPASNPLQQAELATTVIGLPE
jgi:hypothetical protein